MKKYIALIVLSLFTGCRIDGVHLMHRKVVRIEPKVVDSFERFKNDTEALGWILKNIGPNKAGEYTQLYQNIQTAQKAGLLALKKDILAYKIGTTIKVGRFNTFFENIQLNYKILFDRMNESGLLKPKAMKDPSAISASIYQAIKAPARSMVLAYFAEVLTVDLQIINFNELESLKNK